MTKAIRAETLDGLLGERMLEIKEAFTKYYSGVKQCAYSIFAESIPTYLMTKLEGILKQDLHPFRSQESQEELVYDLMNVEESSRFATLDGVVLHNCLGLSYQMTCVGLAAKLTMDTGREWTEEEAQEQIDMFYEVFWRLKEWQEEVEESYSSGNPIILPDGWTMWCDNPNFRSVGNCPVQGTSGVIMRRATVMAMKEGIYSPFQLHDAIYIRDKVGREEKMLRLRDIMREAFCSVFPKEQRKYAEQIRLDPKIWGPDYKDGVIELGKEKWKCPTSKIHIDPRAQVDYERFSPYFKDRVEDRFAI